VILTRRHYNHSRYKEQLFYMPPGQNPLTFDALGFWNNRQEDYPRVAAVARKLFAIPATSAAVQRAFSKSRNLISDYRTDLLVQNIDDLLTVSTNASHVHLEEVDAAE
jgi:hAT family C-terminal dimerisation region